MPEDYVHRIGRTGRAGRGGEAISLVSADESKQLFDIERLIQKQLERQLVEDFWPKHDVPKSPELQPVKSKRPKKSNNIKTYKKNPIKKNSSDPKPKNNQLRRDDQKKPNKPKKKFYWGKK